MKYRTRIYYSEEQKALMWDRWQKGESLHAIARLFDRSHGSIAGILSRTGGIRPRQRTPKMLNQVPGSIATLNPSYLKACGWRNRSYYLLIII